MLGRKRKFLQDISLALDALFAMALLMFAYGVLYWHWQTLGAWFSQLVGYPFRVSPVNHLLQEGWAFFLILLSTLVSLQVVGTHRLDWQVSPFALWRRSMMSVFLAALLTITSFYLIGFVDFNRSLLLLYFGLYGLYHWPKEVLLRRYLTHNHFRQHPLEAVLVAPAEQVARRWAELQGSGRSSLRLKGVILTTGQVESLSAELQRAVLGEAANLSALLPRVRADVLLVGETPGQPEWTSAAVRAAEEQGIEVWYLADFVSPQLARPTVDEFAGTPIIVFKTTAHYEGRLLAKRIFDFAVTAVLLVLISPLLLLIAVLVKLSSPGPIIFKQERTGWRGRPFRMWKFRTMYVDAPQRLAEVLAKNQNSGPAFKLANDPRITPLGRWLRRTSLDELPQLFNIMRGEMSLVGPRPLPVYETEKFEAFRDHRRYSVLPGLTGLWQVSGRSDITDFAEWVRLDLEYIDRWSLWLDIQILLRTVPAVLAATGAK